MVVLKKHPFGVSTLAGSPVHWVGTWIVLVSQFWLATPNDPVESYILL